MLGMFKIALCGSTENLCILREMIAETPGFRRSEDTYITNYSSGKCLLADIISNKVYPDLVFMEVVPHDPITMKAAAQLNTEGRKIPLVLFASTTEMAVEGYEIGASGYILLPLAADKIEAVLKRLLTPRQLCRLMVSRPGRRQYCEYSEIMFLESSDKITRIHLANGECLVHRTRLSLLEKSIGDSRFLRCHQSYLVNMDFIKRVEQDFILADGSIVPIRVRSHRQIVNAYDLYVTSTYASSTSVSSTSASSNKL